ncbi:MAG: hypothetical protein M3P85_01685 [Actinomycetota bacterium]|nr:hypothetical protein [Actinomycetota bacterium]
MRTTRLRSVDTNPLIYPSRAMPDRCAPSDRFAKQAARVCAIYSSELNSAAIEAETWWVRFIPKEGIEPKTYGTVAMTVTLGLGEVHHVPFDAAVLEMPEDERHFATLAWLHAEMLRLADARGWDAGALEKCCAGAATEKRRTSSTAAASGARTDEPARWPCTKSTRTGTGGPRSQCSTVRERRLR